MKITFLLLSLLTICLVNGQTTNQQAIPGTKVSLIPPQGFIHASGFDGFQNKPLNASIMVTEMPAPIESAISGFNADALKQKGMVLAEKKLVQHQGMNGALLKIFQHANGINFVKQILLFGDSKKTILINGIYPESNKQIEPEITTALLSTIYDEKQQTDPLKAAKFLLDPTGTTLVFASYVSASMIYTPDGKMPTQSADKATFIASVSAGNTAIANKKQFTIDRMKKLPNGESTVVKETKPITIDQLNGFEVIGEGKDHAGKKLLVYEVILFTEDNGYYIMIGTASDHLNSWLENFRKMALTFRKK